jgi:hypothetical protein
MAAQQGSQTIERWPEESREAAQLVIDKYGGSDESTETEFEWFNHGKWKHIIASKVCR